MPSDELRCLITQQSVAHKLSAPLGAVRHYRVDMNRLEDVQIGPPEPSQ